METLAVIVGVSLDRNGEAVKRAHKIDLSSAPSVARRSRLLLETRTRPRKSTEVCMRRETGATIERQRIRWALERK